MSIHINHPVVKSSRSNKKLPPILSTDISKDFELTNKKIEYMNKYKSYKVLEPVSPSHFKAPLPDGMDYHLAQNMQFMKQQEQNKVL